MRRAGSLLGTSTSILLLCLVSGCSAQLSCEEAIELHGWALQELGKCEDPATQNTEICGLVGAFFANGGASSSNATGAEDLSQSDLLSLIGNPVSTVEPWQNFLVQGVLAQFADLGEVSYVLTQINNSYSQIVDGNATNEDYYGAWQLPWFAQADANVVEASDYTGLSAAQLYWKAANYYFAGFWPFPFGTEGIERAKDMVDAFEKGVGAHPTYAGFKFSVDFDNGSAIASLPGLMLSPDPTQPLPLYIITGGTDFPKEMNVLQFGLQALERGYAILVYDGPGQGQVIRNPPYMPFYPEWDQVLSAVLDLVVGNYSDYVRLDKIYQGGVSLGGYLGSRACAGNSDRLAACVPNPPITNVIPTYQRFSEGIASNIYGPFQYVAQTNPSLLPPGYAEAFGGDYVDIINTVLLTCNATSGATQLVADVFAGGKSGPIDPELVYLTGGYGGAVTGDLDSLYAAMWQAFRNVQAFGEYDIASISVPVIGIKGTQDDLLGGQEDAFFAQLAPGISDASTLITFDGASGGALHCQVGSPYVLAARQFAKLDEITTANSTGMDVVGR